MTSQAKSVSEYLASLDEERRIAIEAIRNEVLQSLPEGYEEGMQYGAIGYYVPHSIYPPGYHCDKTQPVPFLGIASQKNHIGVYAFCIYIDDATMTWFVEEFKKTGKKLDMGKACIRFKRLADIPLELIGQLVARIPVDEFLRVYKTGIPQSKRK
jgi:uncharacterized protein YdhG (YjbR/CyaY superfamily)